MYLHILPILFLLQIIGLLFFALIMKSANLTITHNDYILLMSVPFVIVLLAIGISFLTIRIKINRISRRG